jgi:hypothetical protein
MEQQHVREILTVKGKAPGEETIGGRNKFQVRFRLDNEEEYEAWLTETEEGSYLISTVMYAKPTGKILESDVVKDHDEVTQWEEAELERIGKELMNQLKLPDQ